MPDHPELLPRLVRRLDPAGVLAVQVPANHASPSHQEILSLSSEEPWRTRLAGRWRPHAVEPLAWCVETLHREGLRVEAWETTYLHVLAGDAPFWSG